MPPSNSKQNIQTQVYAETDKMEERRIGTGGSCFLIKDESLKDSYNSRIYAWLKEEGFSSWGRKGAFCTDWIYINILSKIYAHGMPGVGITQVVANHAITFDEFLTIYNIYKKYEGFGVLKMNKEEQEEFDRAHPLYKMEKIIGCKNLTHEILEDYLSSGWWNREMLPWEHCGMSFQKLCVPMSRSFLAGDIYNCVYNDKSYYFGLGLEEPEVTDDMLKNGTWLVYTWSD